MKRRKFVSNACILSFCSFGLTTPGMGQQSQLIHNSEIQNLCDENYLKREPLSSELKTYLDRLKGNIIISHSDYIFQYDNHCLVEVEVQDIFRKKPGLLFITSSGNHLLIHENNFSELNDFITSFKKGLEQHRIDMNPVEFLFPYHINNNESAIFSFTNKYSHQIMLKKRGNRREIFIS